MAPNNHASTRRIRSPEPNSLMATTNSTIQSKCLLYSSGSDAAGFVEAAADVTVATTNAITGNASG
jgi:hypothetical protein